MTKAPLLHPHRAPQDGYDVDPMIPAAEPSGAAEARLFRA
jgi:hypothetical protein